MQRLADAWDLKDLSTHHVGTCLTSLQAKKFADQADMINAFASVAGYDLHGNDAA